MLQAGRNSKQMQDVTHSTMSFPACNVWPCWLPMVSVYVVATGGSGWLPLPFVAEDDPRGAPPAWLQYSEPGWVGQRVDEVEVEQSMSIRCYTPAMYSLARALPY